MEAAVMKLNPLPSNSQAISRQQEAFSAEFSALPVKKMDELITSESTQLCQLDRKSVELCIFTCIGDYLNFIGAEMKDAAILETAQMMIDNHPHIPVEAIKTFFYECKRGTYGFHYNKMDGTKLLMWYDKFVNEYYVQLEDMEYNKHFSTKGDLADVPNLTDEEGDPIDFEELYASFHGKSKEQIAQERKVKDIRMKIQKEYIHLFNEMPVEEADKIIEDAIIKEMQAQGIINF